MKRLVFLVVVASFLGGCPSKKKTRSSDTFYLHMAAEPKTLDAFTSRTDAYAGAITGQIFDTLLDRDKDTYAPKPSLAESYEVSANGKEFTFKLRKGVTFTDGKPLTAADVKFSFDAIFDDKYQVIDIRPYYENIDRCEVVDDHTVKFFVKKKYFQNLMFIGGMEIVPKHYYEERKKEHNIKVLGSGPWMIDEYKQGRSMTLKKNPNWWGKDLEEFKDYYRFGKKKYTFIKEEKVKFEAFKKGDLDYIGLSSEEFITKTDGDPWGKSVHKETVQNKAPMALPFIGWNNKKELFKDKKVRQALTMLYDRDMMVEKFFYNQADPAAGPWYPANPAADKSRKPLPFNPKKAGEILKAAGWADDDKNGVLEKEINGKKKEFRFTLLNPNPDWERYFTVYKEELKKAGIDMSITNLEWNAFQRKMDEHEFDALYLVWTGTVNIDPKQVWHSGSSKKGGSNFISYKNARVDELIDKGRLELNDEKRYKMFREVYNLIADDAPYIFLFYKKASFYGYNDRVIREKPFYNYTVGTDMWQFKAQVD